MKDFEAITKEIGRLGRYAPGNYMGRCSICGHEFIGDKRASQCFLCAVKSLRTYAEDATAALEPFKRVLAIIEALPTPIANETPLRDALPGIWPTVGDLRFLIKGEKPK